VVFGFVKVSWVSISFFFLKFKLPNKKKRIVCMVFMLQKKKKRPKMLVFQKKKQCFLFLYFSEFNM